MDLVTDLYRQRFISCLVWIILIGSVAIVLVAVVWLIRKRLKVVSDLEKELKERLAIIQCSQCLSVQDATDLEKDLSLLLNLFEESYKIDKTKDQISNWDSIRLNLQKYLRKEITFPELKNLI